MFVRLMDERVWMVVDRGSSEEGRLWRMEWVKEGLSGFVEGVDQVKGEELVDLRVLKQEWAVEVWMLMVLVDKVWLVEDGGWYVGA